MRSIGSISLLVSLSLLTFAAACGDDDGADVDAGRADTGMCGPSPCGAPAAGCHYEGATCTSCGTIVCEDGGPTSCVDCAAPPPGCRLEGGSCASCGTLVCEDAGMCTPPPCAAPPPGCRYEGGGCDTCGTVVCDDAGVPVACGGRAGDPCATTEYCRYEAPSICSTDDSQGVCTAIPDSCPPAGEPVCGCDGMPYPSECDAARARTGISSDATTCGSGSDCRTTGCPGREHCDLCRTTSGPAYVCLPEGAVC